MWAEASNQACRWYLPTPKIYSRWKVLCYACVQCPQQVAEEGLWWSYGTLP